MSRILTTLTCLCISYLAIGQTSEKIMVYGHVADLDTRAPLEGAWVYLMDCNRQLLDSVQADRKEMNYKDAGYMFRATYLPGQYHMKIVYPGHYSPVIPFELKSASEPLPTAYIKKVPAEKDTYAWGLGDEGKQKLRSSRNHQHMHATMHAKKNSNTHCPTTHCSPGSARNSISTK